MKSARFFFRVVSPLAAASLVAAACSSTDDLPVYEQGVAGSSGGTTSAGGGTQTAGKGGAATGGHAGASGASAGGAGKGGSSAGGSAGHAGTAQGGSGTGGKAGHGGTSTGGSTGKAGSSGMGTSGSSGSGGSVPTKHWCDLPMTDDPGVVVPDGFCVRSFVTDATRVNEPRTIRFAPNGDVFVASPSFGTPGGSSGGLGAIFVLPDDDHDGMADSATVYAGGTNNSGSCVVGDTVPDDYSCVHGIAFIDGYLYWTKRNELRRIPYASGDRQAQSPAGDLVANLGIPADGGDYRFTHTIDKAADGKIYVSRGRFDAPCPGTADAAQQSMAEGAVLAIDPNATLPTTTDLVADGFRNPMYVRCNPSDGKCFANELSGDGWDGIGGREKLALLQPVGHYGYPCCVTANDPANGQTVVDCSQVGQEALALALHSTPFGLDFEPGKWAAPYANSVFVAFHGYVGSWLETRVAYVPMDPSTGLPTGADPVDFGTGYGHLPDGNGGRAADLAFAPDGRLFVIDDQSGIIVWIAPMDLPMP